jgi:hypothetical protein
LFFWIHCLKFHPFNYCWITLWNCWLF